MCTISQSLIRKPSVIAGIVFITFLLTQDPAGAGDSWWTKGTDLLKSFGEGNSKAAISDKEIGAGLKDALHVATESVVARLGQVDGFNKDAAVHIPLPKQLATVKTMLDRVGMSQLFDDLELKLNRAAETATPKAKELFWQAITAMSFEDVKSIFEGPQDAATQYFRGKMSPSLAEEMKPVVTASLSEVGALQAYDNVMQKYRSLPFVPDVKANLTDYCISKGMDGIFYYMAKEEADIRQNPAKRTTELLKRVFGSK